MKDYVTMIGLGQCGMRICQEFQAEGYKTFYINSDEIDLRGANVDEQSLLILKGSGTGKSIKVGTQILEKSRSKFESFLKKNTSKSGLTVFVAGAGGGTGGSFIAPAVAYCKSLNQKVGVILTLPPKMLDIVPAENAAKTLQLLLKEKIDFFYIVDNEFLLESIGKDVSWWGKINRKIFNSFNSAIDVIKEEKSAQTGIGSIDKGELIRALTFGKGAVDIRKVYLTIHECSLPPQDLDSLLFTTNLMPGYDYKTTLCYLASIDVPAGGNFTEVAKKIFDVSRKRVGNCVSILGMFSDPSLTTSIRITYIHAGLKLPKILQSRIKNLKRDASSFINKQSKIDTTSEAFTGLDLEEDILEDNFSL